MRIIVHGIGAIGGTIAAALALSGQDVVGIARGAQRDAIARRGLTFRSPEATRVARLDCVGDPSELVLRPDDMVILAVKLQHSPDALDSLRAAGLTEQPVFCAQNGVAGERLALRRFANVHGITVMMPASFEVAGEINAFSTPRHGIFDIGRCPSGADADDRAMAAALEAANIAAFVTEDVMAGKYGKLLLNLGNVVEAALGTHVGDHLRPVLRAEGEAALTAAGIAWREVGKSDPRRDALMRQAPIAGIGRGGSSTMQSLNRGTGSIETDYLNGEIVLLGRLHGVPTTANAWFQMLAARMAREGLKPGAVGLAEAEMALRAAGAALP